MNYMYFWYIDYNIIELIELVSNKKYDDFVEYVLIFYTENMFYRKFLILKFLDGL